VTGEKARNHVHVIRDRVAAVMVGRLPDKEGSDPVRIVVDSKGSIPLDSNVIKPPV